MEVLLIDDEEEFVRALGERLELRGFSTRIALNGEQALRMIEEKVPALAVLDLKMPGMNGIETLRRMKRIDPRIQVIILTGHGCECDKDTALEEGAFDYLQKPVDINDLVSALNGASKEYELYRVMDGD